MLTHPLLGNDTALAELDDLLADVCVESDVNIINPSALSAAFVAGVEAREGRMVFEDNVTSSEFGQASVEDREKGWRAYIAFEIKDNQLFRAQRIYDRAVLNCPQSHFLWRQYIHFASDTVKNVNLLDTVTHRAIRVRPDCTADVDIWRLRFLAIELSSRLTSKSTTTASVPTASSVEIGPTAAPCSASSNGAACSSDGQSELPALVYSALQTAMGCSFSATDDYLTIMKIYCDTFRRSLSKVVAVGAIAVDIISYISSLQAALDFIENYLWTYFDSWAEGWVLYALYRCRIEDGVIEDISCSVDGDINGTPILSRATDVWERLLGSKHGKNYVVWKAALSWAIACRKESDYIRKLFKKAVVTLDGTPVNYVHIDVMSCGPSAVTYNAYLTECPLDTVYGLWVAYEEEFGSTESAQQIVNRRYRALGGQQGRVNRRGPAPASQDSTRATQPVGTTTAHAGFAQQTMAQRKKGKTDRGDRSGGTESGHKKRALVESAAAGSGNEPIDSGKVSKKARKGNHISPTAAEVETVDSSRDGNSAANSTVDVDVGAASNGTANTARNDKHSVFVKNLAFSAKENDIRTVFEDCGALIAVELLTNTLGKSKGMAYVHFATAAAAEKALFKHNTAVAGRPITVESFRGEVSVTADGQYVTPTETFHPTTIFVTKLPREKEVTEDDVRACFAGAVGAVGGLIEACKVVKDKRSGLCKGHALVQFTNRECVKYCMENKTAFKIQDKAVHVGLSKFPVLESKEKPPPNKYLEEA
ncbi:SART3 [Symbiodinium microadriaticum]|nr:SART3 [Symbiodinium microadriaticum]